MRVIDLTGPVGDAPDSKYSRLARTGIIEERADTAVRVSSGSAPEPEGDPRCPAEPRSPVPAAAVVHETPPCPPADEKAGGNPVRLAAVVAVAVAVTVALLVALFAMTGGASGGGQ